MILLANRNHSIDRTGSGGFTLIELILTVVVVVILAAVALPSYQEQIRKARRSDAIESLSLVQQAQEKFRASDTSYSASLTALGFASSPLPSKDGYYSIALSGAGAAGYTVTATPVSGKSQASDSGCASMVLVVAAGSIAQTPPECWNR